MNEACNLSLMRAEHLAHLVFVGQVATQAIHNLASEIVKQVRMCVVRYIVEIDESADDIILQAQLPSASLPHRDHIHLIRAQVLGPELLRYRWIVERIQFERERTET